MLVNQDLQQSTSKKTDKCCSYCVIVWNLAKFDPVPDKMHQFDL